jgi:Flp pilus assembly protein TadG
MMIRKQNLSKRRGVSAVEAAVVYPVTTLLLIGMVVLGLGVFCYQQLQALADEGARYASVHGPQYAFDNNASIASTSTVQTYVQGLAVSLGGLVCTNVNYSSTSLTVPGTVTVTLTYTWKPPAYFNSVTWTGTSTVLVTY